MERSRELPTVNHAMAAHEIYLVYQILPFFFWHLFFWFVLFSYVLNPGLLEIILYTSLLILRVAYMVSLLPNFNLSMLRENRGFTLSSNYDVRD